MSFTQRPSNLLIAYKNLQLKRYSSKFIQIFELIQKHKDTLQQFRDASGPNWELYRPASTRFCLPGTVSMVKYISGRETIDDRKLKELIDFKFERANKIRAEVFACPILIQEQITKMFENKHAGAVAVISLSYDSYDDLSIGKAECHDVARQIVDRLRQYGYWTICSSFFHEHEVETITKDIGKLRVRLQDSKGCLHVKNNHENFEVIYTTAPKKLSELKRILFDPKLQLGL